MIKLIVGLGNPGQEYEKTRHNAGFLFLDYLYSGTWLNESRFNGKTAVLTIANAQVRLLKPMSFMNCSGQAVGNIHRVQSHVRRPTATARNDRGGIKRLSTACSRQSLSL